MTDTDQTSTPEPGVRTAGFAKPTETVGEYVHNRVEALKAGDLGSLPIIAGLAMIVLVFGVLEDQFLTARNFTNLLLQMAPISFLAIGIVFILLIADGEIVTIDLSVASVAATGGAVLVLLQRPDNPGWPWWACILGAVALTTTIGFVHSIIITKLGIPSFVMTLAAFLIWSGVLLYLTTEFTEAGTIRIQDDTLIGLANNFLPVWFGWLLGVIVVAVYAAAQFISRQSRRSRGLEARPLSIMLGQIVAVGVVAMSAVYVANEDRGVPQVTLTLAIFLAFFTFIASSTRFGRHIYAVGGSPEAARRAGISVDGIRIAVFMINGFMAGVGGIILVSRLRLCRHQYRRRQPLAQCHRRRRHRRHQPLRRSGPGGFGLLRCLGHHVHPERHGSPGTLIGIQVHHHGRRAADGCARRLGVQAAQNRTRSRLTWAIRDRESGDRDDGPSAPTGRDRWRTRQLHRLDAPDGSSARRSLRPGGGGLAQRSRAVAGRWGRTGPRP